MKKWHIIVGSAVLFIALVIVGLSLTYRYLIVPKYLEPFAEKANEALEDDALLDALYDQATQLHDDGTLDDDVYSSFLVAYNRHNRDDEEFASEVLGDDTNDNPNEDEYTKRASYASTKVGIDLIQTSENETGGKADTKYSGERSSNRTKAEDIVEAEKIRAGKIDATEEPTEEVEDEEAQAWATLMDHMTASEAARFRTLMSKLDHDILRSYYNTSDMDGLKVYLHANLDDDEYHDLVNMGYKYMNLFI